MDINAAPLTTGPSSGLGEVAVFENETVALDAPATETEGSPLSLKLEQMAQAAEGLAR